MLKHVLVPLDGSELAEKAVSYAKHIVEAGGKITLISAIDVPEYAMTSFYSGGVSDTANRQTLIDNLVKQNKDYLHGISTSYLTNDKTLTVLTEIVVGEPAKMIIDTADELKVDAVVMSTHGRSGLGRWMFGSVTQKVLGSVHCPVLVVPNKA